MKLLRSTCAIVAVSALALAGCSSPEAAPEPVESGFSATHTTGEPVQGGEISYMANVVTAYNWDPSGQTIWDGGFVMLLAAVYGRLAHTNEAGEVFLDMAESFEPSADGATWTMTLKPDISFTDGTPMNAEAVAFNIERLKDPATGAMTMALAQTISTRVVDELTVEFALPAPNFSFDATFANNFWYVVSPTFVAANPTGWMTELPVGAGPFIITEDVIGDYTVAERNEDYYEEGLPYLDKITLRQVADANQQQQTVINGEATMTVATPLNAQKAADAGLQVYERIFDGGQSVHFNFNSVFGDVRARQAFTMAIDDVGLSYAYEPDLQERDAGADGIFREGSQYYNPEFANLGLDPERAQELFDELAADGTPVDISIVVPPVPAELRAAEFMKASLDAFENVTVEIESVDWSTFVKRILFDRDYDVIQKPTGWKIDTAEAAFSARFEEGGSNNVEGYSSPEFEEALDTLRGAQTEEEVKAAVDAVQKIYYDEQLSWVWSRSTSYFIAVQGVVGLGDIWTTGGQLFPEKIGWVELPE